MALRIDFEGVSTCISSMNDAIENLVTIAGDIDATVMNDLGEHWEGDSYNKCIELYSENYQDLLKEKIPDMVGELKEFMETCQKYLKETDSQLAGQ